jgi:uncharacterized spore protein YtfJ
MPLNRLFDTIEQARDRADWRTAFGEPQMVEGKTLIPVAKVGYTFGLGFGSGSGEVEGEGEPPAGSEGGGAGGGASTTPLGALVVTPEGVYFEETMDTGKVSLAGIVFAAFLMLQVGKTLRAIFGRD